MTSEQFEAEKNYLVAMNQAKVLHDNGLVTGEELAAFSTKMILKYKPPISSLLLDLCIVKSD